MQSSVLSDSRTPPQEETLYPLAVTPVPVSPRHWHPLLCSLSLWIWQFWAFPRDRIRSHMTVCTIFFHLAESLHGVSPYQFFTTPYGHLIGCSVIPPILLIHSSLEEWLFWKHFGYFHFLALINNAGISTHVQELYCSKWMYFQLEVWLFVFSYLFHFILLYLAPTFPYGCKMSKYKRKCSLKLWFNAYMGCNHSKLYLHSFRNTFWAPTHIFQPHE